MIDDILGEIAGGVAEAAMETATDEVHRRWGPIGCLTVTSGLVALVMLLLWVLGAFS